jgi:hypothetical protein
MRLSRVVTKNYRNLRDREFIFEKADHDITTIIGDKGSGKTNLINAIEMVIMNEELRHDFYSFCLPFNSDAEHVLYNIESTRVTMDVDYGEEEHARLSKSMAYIYDPSRDHKHNQSQLERGWIPIFDDRCIETWGKEQEYSRELSPHQEHFLARFQSSQIFHRSREQVYSENVNHYLNYEPLIIASYQGGDPDSLQESIIDYANHLFSSMMSEKQYSLKCVSGRLKLEKGGTPTKLSRLSEEDSLLLWFSIKMGCWRLLEEPLPIIIDDLFLRRPIEELGILKNELRALSTKAQIVVMTQLQENVIEKVIKA